MTNLCDSCNANEALIIGPRPGYSVDAIRQLLRLAVSLPDGFTLKVYAGLPHLVDNVVALVVGPEGCYGEIRTAAKEYRDGPLAMAGRIETEIHALIADMKPKIAARWMNGQE